MNIVVKMLGTLVFGRFHAPPNRVTLALHVLTAEKISSCDPIDLVVMWVKADSLRFARSELGRGSRASPLDLNPLK